jgi:hypothetical protein
MQHPEDFLDVLGSDVNLQQAVILRQGLPLRAVGGASPDRPSFMNVQRSPPKASRPQHGW